MNVFLSITYWIILIYIGLSLLVLFLVLTYKEFMLRRLRKQETRQDKWRTFFEQSEPVLSKDQVERLKNTEELLHFTNVLQVLNQQGKTKDSIQAFIYTHIHTWVELGDYYSNQSLILRAYFAWCCKEANIRQPIDDSEMILMMHRYVMFPSVHCRNNALGALYTFGNVKGVEDAFRLLSEQKITFNARLIGEGLASFTGNKQELADVLFEHFGEFGRDFQVGIMDYFRKEGAHLKYQLKDLLKDPTLHLELVCALMRYYEKHPVQAYKPLILSWMSWKYRYQWEIIAVTASTLASYPGEDTVQMLMRYLEADNWFIRKNSAITLEKLGIEIPDLESILSGEQPEAIEQLTYDLASKESV